MWRRVPAAWDGIGGERDGAWLVRKAFYLALILLGVSILCFALLRLSGRDPALAVALRAQSASEENIARLRKELGLTGTPVQQYLRWLSGFVRGDFGYSIYSGRSVALDIAEKLPSPAH